MGYNDCRGCQAPAAPSNAGSRILLHLRVHLPLEERMHVDNPSAHGSGRVRFATCNRGSPVSVCLAGKFRRVTSLMPASSPAAGGQRHERRSRPRAAHRLAQPLARPVRLKLVDHVRRPGERVDPVHPTRAEPVWTTVSHSAPHVGPREQVILSRRGLPRRGRARAEAASARRLLGGELQRALERGGVDARPNAGPSTVGDAPSIGAVRTDDTSATGGVGGLSAGLSGGREGPRARGGGRGGPGGLRSRRAIALERRTKPDRARQPSAGVEPGAMRSPAEMRRRGAMT
ncbi:uncharacterized protein SOCEGT47_007880 [Sorangium cellulosum]|uniref:Uncharacterized protein n=1 Tax=Sorangium cellulosum TaxID=56 RepID=A0A4P2PUP2_SORCE|nr:uncharacterized protein SOCEGT47_007880 [Sorangium cellulosum]